ncbi:PadR family transcriptional regulator [Periweissella cryptocerci]|uniref:PadR family transcriptional regulator n=1 Tax=Periweissella cryptocerci TaxID=2506420 RepID=A0A4P6YTY9_9LACO|nr:PadR family transcriptional regulator [Periweissella cryptocerci]QBO36234.1 PadR family transcriptional regulator [Periweissella cryptocerci]
MKGNDIVLGIIKERPRTGYEIMEQFKTVFSMFFDGSYGTVYPTLKRLEGLGYIEKETIAQSGKPDKNVFHITTDGEAAFQTYLVSAMTPDTLKSDFMTRLYFGEYYDEAVVIKQITEQISNLHSYLDNMDDVFSTWSYQMSESQVLAYNIGRKQKELEIKLLEEYLNK